LIVVVVQVSEDKKKRTKTGISHPISHQKRFTFYKESGFSSLTGHGLHSDPAVVCKPV